MIQKLKNNNKIIVNTDIDGILSGLLLHHFCDCEIVGFSNSIDKVWIDQSKCKTIFDAVYIDMFVAHPNVISIDQHIIALNEEHHSYLVRNSNKINPNIDNPRHHLPNSLYYKKYPFGTVHYLISKLHKEGFCTNSLLLNNESDNLKFIDFLLRADDAMKTSVDSNYIQNASEWWQWLAADSNDNPTIIAIMEYLKTITPNKASTIKTQIADKLQQEFQSDTTDGGFKEVCNPEQKIKENLKTYIRFLADLGGLKYPDLDLNLTCFSGTNYRIELAAHQIDGLIKLNRIDGKTCFSYAFVKSSGKPENFSYTIMKD